MPLRSDQATPGASFSAPVVENLTRTQIVQYAGASGDYNPIHTDMKFAGITALVHIRRLHQA